MTDLTQQPFASWAILEIMGHVRLAGWVTEATIGGSRFIRIDVPAEGDNVGFTRYFGSQSVYSLSPVTEEVARAVSQQCRSRPVETYDLSEEMRLKYKAAATRIEHVESSWEN